MPHQLPPRRRVLVVEDQDDCRQTLVELVSLYGFDVRGSADGPEALRVAKAFTPDVVLLDLGLPQMNGFEVARALRSDPSTSHAFIAAVTGYGTHKERQLGAAAGIDVHLVKPVGLDDLLPALRATRQARP